jgi:hypothetical protein
VIVSQTSPSDFAIVRLDRSALEFQTVAPIRRSRVPLAQGLPVAAIGHADGTFVKISPGGVVTSQDGPGATTFHLNSDGSAAGSLGSAIFYQETGALAGIWTDPSAANTNGGTQNTTDRTIHLAVGDKVTIGTCGLPGASYNGDTPVSLYLGSTRVALNDDDCGSGSWALPDSPASP